MTLKSGRFPLMPIKAQPYAHQQAAYEFALALYGLGGGDSTTISDIRGVAFLMEMG